MAMTEFCLMRGIGDECLLSMASAPEGTCVIKMLADGKPISLACTIGTLEGLADGVPLNLAGPAGFCTLERLSRSVRFSVAGIDGALRSIEVESARFDAAVVMLSAGRSTQVAATRI